MHIGLLLWLIGVSRYRQQRGEDLMLYVRTLSALPQRRLPGNPPLPVQELLKKIESAMQGA